jgi:hypothetical protein
MTRFGQVPIPVPSRALACSKDLVMWDGVQSLRAQIGGRVTCGYCETSPPLAIGN